MIDQVIQWLKEGDEREAADLLSECSLDLLYIDTLFELQGERDIDMFDVHIEAPRKIILKVRNPPFPLAEQIEAAIREWATSSNCAIRDIAWVAKLQDSARTPAAEQVTAVLAKVDSEHIHRAWEKALGRKTSDPEGAITAARTLVESVCKHILEKMGIVYPNDADLPKLYYLVIERLRLTPNQQTEKLVRQILGNTQAVVNGLAALRNELGDAHGKSSNEVSPDEVYAELAVNLAGAVATYLVSVWEKSSTQVLGS
jgi:hypothetical protein